MNPICTFCLNGPCQSSNKCVNRHEKLLCTTSKQVQQTPSIEPTVKPSIKPTTTVDVYKDYKNAGPKSNKLSKIKYVKDKLEQDLKELRNDNAKLKEKIVTLRTSTNILTEQLKEEKNKNAKLTEEFNIALLDSDDYQCSICREVFIRPSLLSCTHMFCEWCIDKWLEKYNHCPTCRMSVANYTHCLNMNNFIQKRMELMPAKIKLAFRDLELARAKEKQISLQTREERRRLDFITMTLNAHRSS